jgi:hypothetical protein
LQRTPARLGLGRAANQLEAVAPPHRQIFGLNRHYGENIRQIEDAEQSRFAVGHCPSGFGRNDQRARPGREAEGAWRET